MRSERTYASVTLVCALAACGKTLHSECPPAAERDQQQFGAIADPLSALHPHQIQVAIDGAAIIRRRGESSDEGGDDLERTDWSGALRGLYRYSRGLASAYAGFNAATSTLATNDPPRGVVQFGAAIRSVGETADESYRRGVALRVDASGGNKSPADAEAPPGTDPFLDLRPLDAMRYGSGWRVQGTFEVRYELLGCYAPFVHLAVGLRRLLEDVPAGSRRDGWTLPWSLSIGAHREIGGDTVMVYAGLDVDVVDPQDRADFNERLRFGVESLDLFERDDRGIRAGFVAEIVLGEVEGTYAGLTLSFPLGGGEP